MSTKIVITNLTQLNAKYGTGMAKIRSGIGQLIKADKLRGIETRLIPLDDANEMKKVNAKPVTDAANSRQNKAAVDAIYKALQPEFMVILGAPDVIPHQDLNNPVYEDGDQFAWGDIPYACERPYSQAPKDFIGPTRVVGRIPDITKGTDPAYLAGMLKTASTWRSRSAADYASYLGISADVWQGSTSMSLRNTFGSAADLQLSPPNGPKWNNSLLLRSPHFINCHGAPSDPHFYGQLGNNFPIAHDGAQVNGCLSEGTVAAAECCYGAELYDPAPVENQQMGICSTYLANAAYGFFGSTTIAYGPANVNGSADLICQYFLKHVLTGASLGRAALEARQQFAQSAPELDPADVKTLAQFNLLGDPSIQPVEAPELHEAVELLGRMRASKAKMEFTTYERRDRRRQLLTKGLRIMQTQAVASKRLAETSTAVARSMRQLAKQNGMESPDFISFDIERPTVGMKRAFATLVESMPSTTAFHVAVEKIKTAPPVIRIAMLVAKEWNGKIVPVRMLFSR